MEENKKTEVNTEVKNTEVKTEGRRNDNRNRKFDKKRPRNNNRTSKPKSDLEDKVIEIRRVTKVVKGGRQGAGGLSFAQAEDDDAARGGERVDGREQDHYEGRFGGKESPLES